MFKKRLFINGRIANFTPQAVRIRNRVQAHCTGKAIVSIMKNMDKTGRNLLGTEKDVLYFVSSSDQQKVCTSATLLLNRAAA